MSKVIGLVLGCKGLGFRVFTKGRSEFVSIAALQTFMEYSSFFQKSSDFISNFETRPLYNKKFETLEFGQICGLSQ